jgi:hypothetical protein
MKTVNFKNGNLQPCEDARQYIFSKSGAEPEKLMSREKIFNNIIL